MGTDNSDYEDLIRPIEHQMIRSVWRIVADPGDAEDAFQDALAKVWKNWGRVRRHPNPHALILRMCANAAYDALSITEAIIRIDRLFRTGYRREGRLV